MDYPVLAGDATLNIPVVADLFAGQKEIVTNRAFAGAAIEQYQPVAFDAAGQLVPWAPAAEDSTAKLVGVAAVAGYQYTGVPYYVSAYFNHERLKWPDAVNTLEKRKAAVLGTEIQVGSILK